MDTQLKTEEVKACLVTVARILNKLNEIGKLYIEELGWSDCYVEPIIEEGDVLPLLNIWQRSGCGCCSDELVVSITLTPKEICYPSIFMNRIRKGRKK